MKRIASKNKLTLSLQHLRKLTPDELGSAAGAGTIGCPGPVVTVVCPPPTFACPTLGCPEPSGLCPPVPTLLCPTTAPSRARCTWVCP
jgi:hypothetical protein